METVSYKKDILIIVGWKWADPGLEKEEGPFLWSCGEVKPEIKGKKVRETFGGGIWADTSHVDAAAGERASLSLDPGMWSPREVQAIWVSFWQSISLIPKYFVKFVKHKLFLTLF